MVFFGDEMLEDYLNSVKERIVKVFHPSLLMQSKPPG
tara:strand:+ start:6719 stop:6829 length:111 start_codon:yes stop_codon:yes gene_type:complete